MVVEVDQTALALDFRTGSVRRDVEGRREGRPGFYLHERIQELRSRKMVSVVANGNNLGYWGNQYAIRGGEVVWKPRGPIFDDNLLHLYARRSPHTFFCARPAMSENGTLCDRFYVDRIDLASDKNVEDSGIWVRPKEVVEFPRTGLSGLPLVCDGESVWQDHVDDAWDPRLIFPGERIVGSNRTDMTREFSNVPGPSRLARHAMTVLGIRDSGEVILMVAERSRKSFGVSVGDVAEIARTKVRVKDAIVLGAAGDAQIGTTDEGILVEPFVADHARPFSRPVPEELRNVSGVRRTGTILARPVPCLLRFDLRSDDDEPRTTDVRDLLSRPSSVEATMP